MPGLEPQLMLPHSPLKVGVTLALVNKGAMEAISNSVFFNLLSLPLYDGVMSHLLLMRELHKRS